MTMWWLRDANREISVGCMFLTSLSFEWYSLLLDGSGLGPHTHVLLSPSECDGAVKGFWFQVSNVRFCVRKDGGKKRGGLHVDMNEGVVCESLHNAAGKSSFLWPSLIFSRFYKPWLPPHGLMFPSGTKLSSHVLPNMLNEKTVKDFNVSSKVVPSTME